VFANEGLKVTFDRNKVSYSKLTKTPSGKLAIDLKMKKNKVAPAPTPQVLKRNNGASNCVVQLALPLMLWHDFKTFICCIISCFFNICLFSQCKCNRDLCKYNHGPFNNKCPCNNKCQCNSKCLFNNKCPCCSSSSKECSNHKFKFKGSQL
jgi:hypothetical protein